MAPGRQTRKLTAEQIDRLERFRKSPQEGAPAGYSLPALRSAMQAPFGYKTLGKALQGLPVWELHHSWLVVWIERYLSVQNGKTNGSGDESDEKEDGATRTFRGSR